MEANDVIKECLEILGFNNFLEHKPSAEDLKLAWKKLCKIHHPDLGGNSEKFKEVSHAYKMLVDMSYRMKYIQEMARGASRNIVGDLNVIIHKRISFEEAFFGREIVVNFSVLNLDEDMNPIKDTEDLPFPSHSVKMIYPLDYSGTFTKTFKHLGNISNEQKGKAIISLIPASHPKYVKQGFNINSIEKIPLHIMLKGGKFPIMTMYGLKDVKIPYGSKPGDQIVLKKYGAGKLGSHILSIQPIFPYKDEFHNGTNWEGLDVDFSDDYGILDSEEELFFKIF